MFIVLLKFGGKRDRAGEHLQGHQQWIQRGLDDGVFLLAGSLRPGLGGAIVAHGITLPALQQRLRDDPFVEHGVVNAEVLDIEPSRVDERLRAVLG